MQNGGNRGAPGDDAPPRAARFVLDRLARLREHGDAAPRRESFAAPRAGRNQFCLFLKPWTTSPGVRLDEVLAILLDRIAAHGLAIDEAAVLPGPYLQAGQIAAAHYWRMTGLARQAAARLPAEAWARFHEAFGSAADRRAVLGGFEFLARFPALSPYALELLWENLPQHRLGKSISCARVAIGNHAVFVVNGFVPQLLQGYARPDHAVIAFALSGPLAWRDARQAFMGDTDPARAAEGSLRRTLFARQAELGIADLRLGANGAHLSAGPIEALAELRRLMSTGPDDVRAPGDFLLGRQLAERFGPAAIDAILANPELDTPAGRLSLFDLTEEMDGDAAIALIARLQPQWG